MNKKLLVIMIIGFISLVPLAQASEGLKSSDALTFQGDQNLAQYMKTIQEEFEKIKNKLHSLDEENRQLEKQVSELENRLRETTDK